jgi:predicted lipid carrier protein YhbT
LATADGRAVRVETADAAWLIQPTPEGVHVRTADVDGADAVVLGEPADLLLWLWNRADDDVVTITGDADLVVPLRKVLAASAG